MKKFILNIKNSIWGKDYLKDFGKKGFWQATGYLAILLFIQLVITFVIPFTTFLVKISNEEDVKKLINTNISEKIEVIVKDGKVSTGDGLPIIIPMPPTETEERMSENTTLNGRKMSEFQNILVINPSASSTVEALEGYKSAILLTNDSLITVDDGGVKITKIPADANFEINRENILKWYEKTIPFIKVGVYVLPVLALVVLMIGSIIFSWFCALIYGLIILLVAKIKKIKIDYKKSYIIAMYASTLLIILDIAGTPFFHGLNCFISILVIALLATINLKK